jgi:outer membrane receptor protein involved in Fe transport
VTRKQNQARPQSRTSGNQRRFQLTPIATIAASFALFGLAGAQAQNAPAPEAPAAEQEAPQALGAVTVRSRSRIEKLQDVPLSISVVQGAELQRLGATGIEEITKRAGNVSWNQGNQRTSSISIRGIGKVGQTEAQDPSVGLIIDGVSYAYNALSSSFDFIDIDTVEVSRGPQGTLLGKNTSVGNIIINTKRPSFTPTADYGLTFRERDGLQAWAAVGGPIQDDVLAWRGTFSVSRGEGDIKNQYNNDVTYTNKDRVSGRVQFLLRPSSDFSALTRFELQPRAAETTNGRSYNRPAPATYADGTAIPASASANDNVNRLSRRWFSQLGSYTLNDYFTTVTNDAARGLVTGSRGASAELNWKLAGDHSLTSITAYKDYHFNAVNDEGTPFDISRNSGGYWNDFKQISQELRLSSPLGGFVDYQTGAYFLKVKNEATYNRIWGNDAGAWFASKSQYDTLDTNAAGRELLRNSLANVKAATNATGGQQDINNKSGALFGQANWHLSEALTFTTGVRVTREIRHNLGSSVILDNGNAPELNPVSINGVSLGGFSSNANGELGTNSAQQLALADATAKKYFGAANYAALTANQKKQIAAAKSLRQGQLGVLFNPTQAEPYIATQPSITLSPSYKISPDLTAYFSFQHGEKAGISQFYNGRSYPVKAEKTNNYELGFKSALLDKTLVLNADVFLSKIKDYQGSVRVLDAYTTQVNVDAGKADPNAYATVTSNAPKVKVSGLEVDAFYAGLRNVTLRFSGAYNRAVYESFPNAAYPVEENNVVTSTNYSKDVSGKTLPGAPRFTFNLGAEYRKPVFADKEFHLAGNLAYTSSYLSDNALSTYSRIPGNFLVDAAVGLGKADKTFDVSLLVKNLFNNTTPLSQTWTSVNPGTPRSFGIQITGKL